jgi:hypothetical protein
MRHIIISSVVFLVVGLVFCSMTLAQEPTPNTSWDACLKAPTRACILDEALVHALAIEPSEKDLNGMFVRTTQLGKIAQAQAAAGNVQTALRIAQLIPSDQVSRVTALRSIATTQARLGMASEAKETFTQARQFADALADQLSRAEVLHSLAEGEAEAGMAAEATNAFEESLQLAETVAAIPEVLASSPCMSSASAETRLDGLLKGLAEQQARAGSLSKALRAARSQVCLVRQSRGVASDCRTTGAARPAKGSQPYPERGIGGRARVTNADRILAELPEGTPSGG